MARVTMRPQALNGEILALIETQAEGTESFTLPGEVVVEMSRLARRALANAAPAVASPAEKPGHEAGKRMAEARTELQDKAYEMLRFLTTEQRLALRMALHNAVSQ